MNGGFVYLLEARPGDPRLPTLRPFELLRSAEVRLVIRRVGLFQQILTRVRFEPLWDTAP
jgi:siroheme synthase